MDHLPSSQSICLALCMVDGETAPTKGRGNLHPNPTHEGQVFGILFTTLGLHDVEHSAGVDKLGCKKSTLTEKNIDH